MPTSKQSASQSLPAYMRKRVDIPGPNTGMLSTFCWHYDSIAAAAPNTRHAFRLPATFRLLAVGWYFRTCSNGTLTLGIVNDDAGTSATSIITGSAITPTSVLSGIIYLNDTAASTYITLSTTTTDPELQQAYLAYRPSGTAGPSILDCNLYAIGFYTGHPNVDKSYD